jgi:serine/threonine protein kinase
VAQALEHTNERGIVHSYIKPRNLMITPTGMVKMLELGIAQVHSLPSLTQTGFVGSMYYISPEQATGGRVDIRSGIYSLGIIMYEMLAGAPPFTASSPWMIVNMHISGQIVPLSQRRSGTPEEVEWLINKALVKDPQDRFQTPGELREAVEWVSQETQTTRPQKQRRADTLTQRPGPSYLDVAVDDAEVRRRQEQATTLYGRGLMHYGAREWREAKALFEEVAELVPNFQDTETLLAVINERLG